MVPSSGGLRTKLRVADSLKAVEGRIQPQPGNGVNVSRGVRCDPHVVEVPVGLGGDVCSGIRNR
jgi:hypothetical protein